MQIFFSGVSISDVGLKFEGPATLPAVEAFFLETLRRLPPHRQPEILSRSESGFVIQEFCGEIPDSQSEVSVVF